MTGKISNSGSQTCHRLAISDIGLNALVTSTANIYSLLLNQKEYLIEIWIWESKTLMINKILYLKTRICLLTLRWNFIGPKFVIFLKPDIEFSSYLIPVMSVHLGPVIKHFIFAWFEIGGAAKFKPLFCKTKLLPLSLLRRGDGAPLPPRGNGDYS